MERRDFMGVLAALGVAAAPTRGSVAPSPVSARVYQLELLERMAAPVLESLAQGKLKKSFVPELSPTWRERDPRAAYLECFGRLLAGLAPWLNLPDHDGAEGVLRGRLRQWALQALSNAVDPSSPDYLAWDGGPQTLVDSSYLTNALLRAPGALWRPLDTRTKGRLIAEIRGARRYQLPYNNWLLFAAMNEAWLASVGEDGDILRMSASVRKVLEWYVGDGWFSDGAAFHFDYYNSYVIHPMLLEILEQMTLAGLPVFAERSADLLKQQLQRTQRYCELLERMVSPEGTYPSIGRSLTYRTAAFQPLALLALKKQLPTSLPEGQVRDALDAVHRMIWAHPTNFTKEGFLTLGFCGHNPDLADWYSNSGSMYITATSLLTLGLPASDSYWTTAGLPWTQKRAFGGRPFARDYAVSY